MNKFKRPTTSLALGVVATFALAAPFGVYADGISSPSVTLRIKASDLATPVGARRVYLQLTQSANVACGTSDSDMDVIVRHGPGKCVKTAIANAVLRLNKATLSQVYIEQNGEERAAEYGISAPVLTAKQ